MDIKTKDKTSSYSFIICVYYLPPEVNVNGRISQEFYDYLTNIIFRIDDNDFCLFMGDMNARCGNEADIVTIIDKDIPDRVSIDDTKNSRGTVFLDFLKSVNHCMLNGRITPDLDNFTCISHKGRSVVDYLFVGHESISNINQFSVLTVTDLCQSLNIQATRAMPDHSILSANVIVRHTVETHSPGSNDKVLENSQVHVLNERMHLNINVKICRVTL